MNEYPIEEMPGYTYLRIQLAKAKNTLNLYNKTVDMIIGRIVMDKEISSTAMFYSSFTADYYSLGIMEEIVQYMKLVSMVGAVSIRHDTEDKDEVR